jgi:deazaflavin-dependent oxidoreductase (nitroreductase family)
MEHEQAPAAVAQAGLVRRVLNRVAPTRIATAVMRTVMVPIDTALQRRTTSRLSVGRALGMPCLLLTTTGARSGLPRQVPLFCVPHAGGFAVVGSNFGQAHHPAWSTNLLRHPHTTIAVRGRNLQVTARRVDGAERKQVWRAILAASPGYQVYNDRSGRNLRIFHLQPVLAECPSTQQPK